MILLDNIQVKHTNEFAAPKDKHYSMQEGWSLGSAVLNTTGPRTYYWRAFIEGNKVKVQREDSSSSQDVYAIPNGSKIQQLDLTFDANMQTFLAIVMDSKPYYYGFDANANTYAMKSLDPDITYPRCDYDNNPDISKADVILGYMRPGGKLYYTLQRERFLTERLVKTDPQKSMLWRCGLSKDGRLAFQWR